MNLQEEIAKVAHELYERSGCINGRDVENWLEAEKIVFSRHAGQDLEEPEGEESFPEEAEVSETAALTGQPQSGLGNGDGATVMEEMEAGSAFAAPAPKKAPAEGTAGAMRMQKPAGGKKPAGKVAARKKGKTSH
jgi:hypothetical protein